MSGRYFDNGKTMGVDPIRAREMIGKKIRYLTTSDIDKSGRGYFFPRVGTISDFYRNQVCIDGNYIYISNIIEYEVLDE